MLRLDSVCKRYGDFVAVDDLSLHIAPGRLFGLLGPNGAGKTTTMKMVAGLVAPTSGRIEVGGLDVKTAPLEVKARIGYVPDRPNLYERLTAREYMYFIAGLYRMQKAVVLPRTDELLGLFGLGHRRDALIEGFSHGMKQRLVMASVLLHEPSLLIVDEPMVGLDPRGIRLLKEVLRAQTRELGRTVVFSTHTLIDAEELCDEVAIIHRGRIVAQGAPRDLMAGEGEARARLEEVFMQLTADDETGLSPLGNAD
ncbi:MAG: ABC transporter ATP-binding protein [Myxococcales bacterium]|nr:ABC transporter ATP-binding protein [Myxococcales bacterium]